MSTLDKRVAYKVQWKLILSKQGLRTFQQRETMASFAGSSSRAKSQTSHPFVFIHSAASQDY